MWVLRGWRGAREGFGALMGRCDLGRSGGRDREGWRSLPCNCWRCVVVGMVLRGLRVAGWARDCEDEKRVGGRL